jgi:hypothetical protein
MTPIFSHRDAEAFAPAGSPRTYTIAPLTFRERQGFRADLVREAGVFPPRPQLLDALRAALRDMAPGNLPDLLAAVDTASAVPDDPKEWTPADHDAQVRLAAIEAACGEVPAYTSLLAARQLYLGMLPWVAARHTLRGWDGPGLPAFRRERGLVPGDLLDLLPDDELQAVGWRASEMMQPGPSAEGNSVPPSLSPAIPELSTAG